MRLKKEEENENEFILYSFYALGIGGDCALWSQSLLALTRELGQVTQTLQASLSLSVKWG